MKNIIFEYDDLVDFQEYLDSLPVKDSVQLFQVIYLIEEYGIQQAQKMEWTKKLEKNLYEIRSKRGSNINELYILE